MNGSTLDSIDNIVVASLKLCSQVSVLQIASDDRNVLFGEKKRLECELAALRRASGGPIRQSVSAENQTDGLSGFHLRRSMLRDLFSQGIEARLGIVNGGVGRRKLSGFDLKYFHLLSQLDMLVWHAIE